MSETTAAIAETSRPARARLRSLKMLVGSGERIGLLVLPFLIVGVGLNAIFPSVFAVGGPSVALRTLSLMALVPGVVIWAWSVVLILARVPRHELITGGPYALVKHPLYTGVGLLVIPSVGFLLNNWLGVVIGAVVYLGCRLYAPAEERILAKIFGADWDAYVARVLIPWL